jgi:hypothetical protein
MLADVPANQFLRAYGFNVDIPDEYNFNIPANFTPVTKWEAATNKNLTPEVNVTIPSFDKKYVPYVLIGLFLLFRR